jgi:hypothetical protein
MIKLASSACIPNVLKSVLCLYDTFQWYFNGAVIPGAISNEYTD